ELADKSTQLIVEALTRAAAEPLGMSLHGHAKKPGLFAATGTSKLAAQRCIDEGFLRVLQRQSVGRSIQEICTVTEKGITYLLDHTSPKRVLSEIAHTLEAYQKQVVELAAFAQKWIEGIEALRSIVERALETVSKPAVPNRAYPGSPPSVNGSEIWIAAAVA